MLKDYADIVLRGMDRGTEAFQERMRQEGETGKLMVQSFSDIADSVTKIPSLIRKRQEEDDVASVDQAFAGALLNGGDDEAVSGTLRDMILNAKTRAGKKRGAEVALKWDESMQRRRGVADDIVRATAAKRLEAARKKAGGMTFPDYAAGNAFALSQGFTGHDLGMDQIAQNERAAMRPDPFANTPISTDEAASLGDPALAGQPHGTLPFIGKNADRAQKATQFTETSGIRRAQIQAGTDRAAAAEAGRNDRSNRDRAERGRIADQADDTRDAAIAAQNARVDKSIEGRKAAAAARMSYDVWTKTTQEGTRHAAEILDSVTAGLKDNAAKRRALDKDVSIDDDERVTRRKELDDSDDELRAERKHWTEVLSKPIEGPKDAAPKMSPAEARAALLKRHPEWNGKLPGE